MHLRALESPPPALAVFLHVRGRTDSTDRNLCQTLKNLLFCELVRADSWAAAARAPTTTIRPSDINQKYTSPDHLLHFY